jgi:hypothetical protein
LFKEGEQLQVVIDVAGISHHDDASERLGGSDSLVVNGKGVERAIRYVCIERDDAQANIGQLAGFSGGGYATLTADGYKAEGDVWWAIKLCRFGPGSLTGSCRGCGEWRRKRLCRCWGTGGRGAKLAR